MPTLICTYPIFSRMVVGPLWSWLYGSWIYNYLCNQCLSPLVVSSNPVHGDGRGVLDTTVCDNVCQWLATWTVRWFCLGTLVSSINKTYIVPPRYMYNWNIVESGIKHQKPIQTIKNGSRNTNFFCMKTFFLSRYTFRPWWLCQDLVVSILLSIKLICLYL